MWEAARVTEGTPSITQHAAFPPANTITWLQGEWEEAGGVHTDRLGKNNRMPKSVARKCVQQKVNSSDDPSSNRSHELCTYPNPTLSWWNGLSHEGPPQRDLEGLNVDSLTHISRYCWTGSWPTGQSQQSWNSWGDVEQYMLKLLSPRKLDSQVEAILIWRTGGCWCKGPVCTEVR